MTADMDASIRASRFRVPRTRGAMSGVLLILLGAWAALAPMIGPYFDLAYTPAANDTWHWTAGRGWLEVLPGAAVFLGGLLLLLSASRVVASFGGWVAAAGGAWLIVGLPLADTMNITIGTPDPTSSTSVQAVESLTFFYGVGAVIVFLAAVALGRLSVRTLRDMRAAEQRVAEERAAAATPTTTTDAPTTPAPATQYTPAPAARDWAGNRGPVSSGGRHGRTEDGETGQQPTTDTTQMPTTEEHDRYVTH